MIESLAEEPRMERAPQILAVSLYRAYPRFAQERMYVPREVFWVAESSINDRQSVLIRGDIDLEKPRLVDALSTVDIGVVSLDDAAGMWLRVDDPSRHLSLPRSGGARSRVERPMDSYSHMVLEHLNDLRPHDGQLIESRNKLGLIADYVLQTIIVDEVGPTDPYPITDC